MWGNYKNVEFKIQRCAGLTGLPTLNSRTDRPRNILDHFLMDERLGALASNSQLVEDEMDPKKSSGLLKVIEEKLCWRVIYEAQLCIFNIAA